MFTYTYIYIHTHTCTCWMFSMLTTHSTFEQHERKVEAVLREALHTLKLLSYKLACQ